MVVTLLYSVLYKNLSEKSNSNSILKICVFFLQKTDTMGTLVDARDVERQWNIRSKQLSYIRVMQTI